MDAVTWRESSTPISSGVNAITRPTTTTTTSASAGTNLRMVRHNGHHGFKFGLGRSA